MNHIANIAKKLPEYGLDAHADHQPLRGAVRSGLPW